MKITNLKKCLLSLQVSDPEEIDYYVEPTAKLIYDHNNIKTYEYEVDVNSTSTISIHVTRRIGSTSHILIKNFTVDDIELLLDNISVYKTANGKIKKTYNFLDEVGTFSLKIHTNPISQNYLNFILGLTLK